MYSSKSFEIINSISKKNANMEIQEYKCKQLNILLNDSHAIVYCKKKMIIDYEDFAKYQFLNVDCPIHFQLEQNKSYLLDYKLNKVLPSLKLTERRDIFFSYYEDINSLTPFIKVLPYENVEFWMYINENDEDGCKWTISEQIFKFYYQIIEYTNWRMACYANHSMLHLNDNTETLEVVELPNDTCLILLILLVSLVLLVFIANCIIAFCKFKAHEVSNY